MVGILGFLLAVCSARSQELVIEIHRTSSQGVGESLGTVTASKNAYGTLLRPDLKGLTPGIHGFHVHQNPDCGPAEKNDKTVPGLAAGGHYDPTKSGKHEGPYGNGHIGDLPPLYVDAEGRATTPVLAPRLKLSDLKGRSLMIHAAGDNFSDHPKKLGGGGARAACGVVK
ncbi:MAG: superoxide dismutase [Cu-Zn] SodC [Acidobacteriota bacterium]